MLLEKNTGGSLPLDGEDVKLKKVMLRGKELKEGDGYTLEKEKLIISSDALEAGDSQKLWLETEVEIEPEKNTQLSGLYFSGSMYCTQMEAEGFRRFTYYLDRPDVMSKFTSVRLEADESKCPILLSNGNRIDSGKLEEGRHFAVWSDPFAKPSYLFAVVAGDLASIQDQFVTKSGRKVHLEIFAAKEDKDQLWHAMRSLQNSMKWDEDRFGLEYDLDIYNIVAVKDFNMGAMENKSLNVFNTSLTLAREDTATDDDYERIEGEGLTVYRDQEFSADMGSRARKRIEDVRILRAAQFPEDNGPMSHPIRPEKYAAIDNFYTATVYNKGAEVIRMYETLLGRDGFRKGMDLYFERHDGNAVTCDDFRSAMQDANERDLSQFERWYLQAGTPIVKATDAWDAETGTYSLTLEQTVPDTPGQTDKSPMQIPTDKSPMQIPVRVGLLDRTSGKELMNDTVLELCEAPERECSQKAVLDAFKAEDVDSFQPDTTFMDAMRRIVQDQVTDDLSLMLGMSWLSFSHRAS
eukprot:symbB.v1.2.040996.t1/scaffold7721.1/size12173/2